MILGMKSNDEIKKNQKFFYFLKINQNVKKERKRFVNSFC